MPSPAPDANEEERMRSVALQNARSILHARQRAEEELRKQSEWLRVTLASIGDAVISTDAEGRVTFMNAVAESLTAWSQAEALGHPLPEVFRIINEQSRAPVENPAFRALKEGVIVGLANHTILIARDGTEKPIDDSAAPIRSETGDIIGSVLIFRDITERHHAEGVLRESEQRYRTLFESMIEGFCIIEVLFDEQQKPVDFRFVQVNPAFEKHTGLRGVEGRRMRELVPAHEQVWFDIFGRVALTGEPARFENYAEALGRWFEVSATRLDSTSHRVGIVFNDITQRRRDQEILRESQARFDLVRDAAQVGFWFCDLPFDVLNWDARVKAHLWLPADATVTIETFYERLPPEDRERVRQAIAASIANKTGYDIEYRTVAADEREKWIRAIGRTFYDGEGKAIRFDGVTLDITERRQTEQALRESQAQTERQRRIYEAILTNTPDFAYVFSLTHRVVYANETLLKMWGRTPEDTLGRTFLELGYEPWHAEMHNREIDQVASTRLPIRGEVPFNGTFGRRIYDYIFVPVCDAHGEVQAVAGTTRDVTDRKQAEETLRAAQAKLEEHATLLETRVAERTSELTVANEQLEAFVYSIAHDLRAPLRSMTSFSQMLLDDHAAALDDTGKNFLKRTQVSSEFMDKLLLDLLAYGRILNGEMELGPVEMEKAWQAALFQAADHVKRSGAHIEVMGPMPLVRAHEATLGQCLTNLLSNAVKFVAPGVQPRIRLRVEEVAAASDQHETYIRLWIEDNGIGIAPEHQERAFRVFERLYGTRYPGTGIGLSIVRKGIERMGGRVGLESVPGQGSRFWMDLRKA